MVSLGLLTSSVMNRSEGWEEIAKGAMAKPTLSPPGLARIKALQQEAGADLLVGLDGFWCRIGLSTKALREHDPFELMPLFERYAEKLFDAEAREWLVCLSDPDAYALHLTLVPMTIAARICPSASVIPDDVVATDWKDLYRTLKARATKSGRKSVLEEFGHLSGDWENYLDHSFSRRFLKGRITTTQPDKAGAVKNFMALFWLKYLFHLRLFANHQRFIQRLCTHMSVRLRVWRAEAYRRMADTLLPPALETDLGAPQALPDAPVPAFADGEVAAARTPRKRGPKPDHDTALRVAEIVARVAADNDWRSSLDEICDALDEEHISVPSTWRRNRDCRNWSVCDDRDVIVKAIEYRLRLARQRKKAPPQTLS